MRLRVFDGVVNISDTSTADHYTWGEVCDGWHLLQHTNLSVIQEHVPPGSGEVKHFHSRAEQFFYVLSGTASLEFNDQVIHFGKGQGVHVPAQTVHRFANNGNEDVVFLVISSPSTSADRTNVSV